VILLGQRNTTEHHNQVISLYGSKFKLTAFANKAPNLDFGISLLDDLSKNNNEWI
jgi:hypothetical protein